jgi:hypothetical protein
MSLINFLEVIIFICICLVIYNIFYSPKARIRIIWRQIYRIPIKMARAKRQMPDEARHFDEMSKQALDIRYRVINALLEYHFDPEEDKEYIQENKNKMPLDLR